jgi:hypothetical protein
MKKLIFLLLVPFCMSLQAMDAETAQQLLKEQKKQTALLKRLAKAKEEEAEAVQRVADAAEHSAMVEELKFMENAKVEVGSMSVEENMSQYARYKYLKSMVG